MSKMIESLGTTLAQTIGKEAIACRGLLRLAIIDSAEHLRQTSDYSQTMAHIKMMGYQDWKDIVEGPALVQRLKGVGITDPAPVVARLRQTLIEQQSLFTMSAH